MFFSVSCFCFVFFFMQKTAYELRISDWSSDVCSSDLLCRDHAPAVPQYWACRSPDYPACRTWTVSFCGSALCSVIGSPLCRQLGVCKGMPEESSMASRPSTGPFVRRKVRSISLRSCPSVPRSEPLLIGGAHVTPPVPTAQLVYLLLLE